MIVDTSAVVAMVKGEPDADRYRMAVRSQAPKQMSAGNYLEVCIVIGSQRDPVQSRLLDEMLARYRIAITPVTETHAHRARQAYRDFGKGSGHPAQLNFGDCFAYALAVETGEALLYKGDDFVHTGVPSAL